MTILSQTLKYVRAQETERLVCLTLPQLRTLILINMGSILDLPSPEWFGEFPDHLRVHVIDSNRPQNLSSLFGPDGKIVIWDDGGAEELQEQKKAWEKLAYAPEEDSDDDSEDSEDDLDEEEYEGEDDEEGQGSSSSGKRRRTSPSTRRKRRKVEVSFAPIYPAMPLKSPVGSKSSITR